MKPLILAKRDELAAKCLEAYFNGDSFGGQESVQSPDNAFKAGWDACAKTTRDALALLPDSKKESKCLPVDGEGK